MNVFDGRKLFVPFVVVGDPDYDTSKKIIMKMIDEGADMLELGFAFSDPIADGPTIQLADKRALDNGACVDSSFRMIREINILILSIGGGLISSMLMLRLRVLIMCLWLMCRLRRQGLMWMLRKSTGLMLCSLLRRLRLHLGCL